MIRSPFTQLERRPAARRDGYRSRLRRFLSAIAVGALVLAACGGDDTNETGETAAVTEPVTTEPVTTEPVTTEPVTTEPVTTEPVTTEPVERRQVTLLAYDSFPVGGTTLNDALGGFSERTGIDVTIRSAGDTGSMVSKAVLTAGNPEGDVLWGVDNTFLSRVIDGDVFEPYVVDLIDQIPSTLRELVPDGIATPVNFGDVCVNYDIEWFQDVQLDPPSSFDDLADPRFADLLVVQNPATSSPGLAFLLGTIAAFGEDGWQDYWRELVDNGVEVTEGWTEAYYERFSWAGGGPRPLVVSYGSSPPAEVLFADPPRDDAPTGVAADTCFRQIEFVGLLRGTSAGDEARELIDFLVSEEFQSELALNLFVYPANERVQLPEMFVEHAVVPERSLGVDPATIDARRADWIDEWTELVLG